MVSIQKAQTGKRLYGMGARQAPNKGAVSARGASGYMQRELRKKSAPRRPIQTPYGKDGKSDRRSGVAAEMLKQKSIQVRKASNGSSTQTTTETQFAPKPTQLQQMQDKVQAQKLAGQAQTPPAIKVNDKGLLELPYNQQFAEAQYEATDQANQQLLGLKSESDQQALQYGQQKRTIGQEHEQNKARTLNTNAARGTAFSSMYGTAVANNANQYANEAGNLEAQNTAYQQNLAAQRAAIQNSLSNTIQRATQSYGDALGGEAGTLGYGTEAKVSGAKAKAKAKIPVRKAPISRIPKKTGRFVGQKNWTSAAQKAMKAKKVGKK